MAGAFTLDGLGAPFVRRVEGDPAAVVGLSLTVLRTQLAKRGLAITDLWRPLTTPRFDPVRTCV